MAEVTYFHDVEHNIEEERGARQTRGGQGGALHSNDLSPFVTIRIFRCNRGLTNFNFLNLLQLQEGPRLHLKMRMHIIRSDLVLLDAHRPPGSGAPMGTYFHVEHTK